jgi:hypothetical protein
MQTCIKQTPFKLDLRQAAKTGTYLKGRTTKSQTSCEVLPESGGNCKQIKALNKIWQKEVNEGKSNKP